MAGSAYSWGCGFVHAAGAARHECAGHAQKRTCRQASPGSCERSSPRLVRLSTIRSAIRRLAYIVVMHGAAVQQLSWLYARE